MSRSSDSRSVTAKVLAILEAFGPDHATLSLSEIAQSARISKPTAHRRAAELVEWGALERDEGGAYRIGLRLWELAALAPRALPLRELALPSLEDLLQLTGGNAQLAVRAGREALFIERLRGRKKLSARTSAANRLPIAVPAVGRALLAFSPADVQEEVLSRPIPRYTAQTVTDPQEMRAILEETRRFGYAVSPGQIEVRSASVGSPIFGADGELRAAIGVVVDVEQLDAAHLGGIVRALAQALSRRLGADAGQLMRSARQRPTIA